MRQDVMVLCHWTPAAPTRPSPERPRRPRGLMRRLVIMLPCVHAVGVPS